jgi:hypothetical protein
LPELTDLHPKWYNWDTIQNKWIKIVPKGIKNLLTPIGIAHWIMGDGYWEKSTKTVIICTDSFTEEEVILLIRVLKDKFNLNATVKKRKRDSRVFCWRIRLASDTQNIIRLQNLIKPFFIPEMLYKINLTTTMDSP